MKTTLTLNDLAQLFAQRASLDNAEAENFIRFYFSNIATALQTDGQVTINGFGTFSRNPETNVVSFLAAPELAEKVNEPFSFFEAVELDDKYVDAEPQTTQEPVSVSEPEPEPEPEPELQTVSEPEPENALPEEMPEEKPEEKIEEKAEEKAEEKKHVYRVAPKRIDDDDDDDEEEEELNDNHGRHHLPWWIPGLVGLFIGFAIGYSINLVTLPETSDYDMDDPAEEQTAELAEPVAIPDELPVADNDTLKQADTEQTGQDTVVTVEKPAVEKASTAEVIKDTVKPGYYLTTMARKHYGKTDFWCYIYEENKDKIRNPNQIASGTEVIIPPASKYGIDPNDPESIKRAKNKIAEINRRLSKN